MPIASTWSLPGGPLGLDGGVLVGVLNVTPDSFSDGGAYFNVDEAVAHAQAMVEEGAGVIDVGGESTRPGARPVDLETEASRILPVIERLATTGVPISVDTYKPEMALRAIESGASIVNDITGFGATAMREVAADQGCAVVIMHGRESELGSRSDVDVVAEVEGLLLGRVEELVRAGVDLSRIAIDPGLGFAKRADQSVSLIAGLGRLAGHGVPVMLGASRKGFIGTVTGADGTDDRDSVTAVLTAIAYRAGARLFRVHDVAHSRGALRMAAAIVASQ